MVTMRTNVPRAVRALRIRRRWRQQDLAGRAGMGRDTVSRVETGRLDALTIGTLDRLVSGLNGVLVVDVRWRGADLDRLIDRAHAHLSEAAARRLARAGWEARAEVTFNHYGDRGSVDILALHPPTRTVLLVEVKSRIGNLQDLLLRLDVKVRLADVLAQGLGWPRPDRAVRAIVLPDDRTARRTVRTHRALFAPFTLRGRAATRWLSDPVPTAGLLWFEQPADTDRTGVMRVRRSPRAADDGVARQ
jgi:transcriptional regulator with XRE-family HTH domain